MSGFTIVHLDDLERPYPMWALARKALGLAAFGMNVAEIPAGASIPEHDELGRDQEEVFLVLDGSPTMVIDGVDHPAPKGTFVRCDPAAVRTVRNDGDELARVLIVSAPTTSGYEPMGWA